MFLKFACLVLSLSPNDVAVAVPARQAYSHWASVGSRKSQPFGSVPSFLPSSVSLAQKASAWLKFTPPTGRSSSSGSSAVAFPGSSPITRFHCPCVVSYLAVQNPLVSVTSTCFSSGRWLGSVSGLPIVNLPGGHQHSLIPAISFSVPAFGSAAHRYGTAANRTARQEAWKRVMTWPPEVGAVGIHSEGQGGRRDRILAAMTGRSQELDAQVAAAGKGEGQTFNFDKQTRTPNTLDAHRIIWLAGEKG